MQRVLPGRQGHRWAPRPRRLTAGGRAGRGQASGKPNPRHMEIICRRNKIHDQIQMGRAREEGTRRERGLGRPWAARTATCGGARRVSKPWGLGPASSRPLCSPDRGQDPRRGANTGP